MLIGRADAQPGEHAVHIGAGTGYYTAILAHMVGGTGRVTAIEYDAGLAERLAANFAGQPNVCAMHGDGAHLDFDPADVIYVNAGATRPAALWLDRLNDGGRLILAADCRRGWRRLATRRGVPHRTARRGVSRQIDFGGGHLPLRGRARRRVRAGGGGGVREARLGAGDAALPQRRLAGGAVLAKRAGLVPGLRLRSVARLPRCAHSSPVEAKKSTIALPRTSALGQFQPFDRHTGCGIIFDQRFAEPG
jgi:protein-L-isoaspartate O-methyltransferase